MFDFSNYPLSNKYYGGSEKKLGIIISNDCYMLKFQKRTEFGLRFNHISEYLGTRIFSMLGFKTQEVYLGTYHQYQVVACKDFISSSIQFVPFNDVGESTLDQDKELYQYSYEDIMKMLEDNRKLTNVKETISVFWDMFIVDALIGNFDRHGANWGFLKSNNEYSLAPIFDNGSCLFPSLIDENEMVDIMNSKEKTYDRVFKFPTSQIKLNNKKSSYFEVINSLKYDECNKALLRIFPKINLNTINELINQTSFISDTHKAFYKYIIENRYKLIIEASYSKLKEQINE